MKALKNREDVLKVYELNLEFDNLMVMSEALLSLKEAGEDIEEMQKDLTMQFEELEYNTEFKLENIVKLIRNMEAETTAYETEISRMKKKQATIINHVNYIKEHLVKPMLERRDDNKLKAGVFSVSLRKSQAVKILDEKLLTGKYLTPVFSTKIDKKLIKADIKEGLEVAGAELVDNKSIQIK